MHLAGLQNLVWTCVNDDGSADPSCFHSEVFAEHAASLVPCSIPVAVKPCHCRANTVVVTVQCHLSACLRSIPEAVHSVHSESADALVTLTMLGSMSRQLTVTSMPWHAVAEPKSSSDSHIGFELPQNSSSHAQRSDICPLWTRSVLVDINTMLFLCITHQLWWQPHWA